MLPVGPRRVLFDVDLGPDEDGGVVAVFSRCRREPERGGGRGVPDFLPAFTRGRRCDVHKFDFGRGVERAVPGASRRAVSEFRPSIWKDRLVFARTDPRRRGTRGVQLQLLRRGRRSTLPHPPPGESSETTGGLGPIALGLRGKLLAYVWDRDADCRSSVTDPPFDDEYVRSEVWTQRLGSPPDRVASGCNTERVQAFSSPSLAAGRLSFLALGLHPRFRTIDLRTGGTTAVPAPVCPIGIVRTKRAVFGVRRVPCNAPERDDPDPYYAVYSTKP